MKFVVKILEIKSFKNWTTIKELLECYQKLIPTWDKLKNNVFFERSKSSCAFFERFLYKFCKTKICVIFFSNKVLKFHILFVSVFKVVAKKTKHFTNFSSSYIVSVEFCCFIN